MERRVRWIDIAKGYGILFVILGHLGLNYVYTFHIPLFFFLSGYVFCSDKYSFLNFVKNKIKSIIIPYFSLGIPIILFEFLSLGIKKEPLIEYFDILIAFIIQRRMWTLWFIACLFWVNILFFIIVRKFNNNYKNITITVIILSIISLIYYKLGGVPLPWNIDAAFIGIVFFYSGYLFKNSIKLKEIILTKNKVQAIIIFIVAFIVNIVCSILNKIITDISFEMFYSRYGFAILTFTAAFAGIVCVLVFSNSIYIKSIEYIGKHSLVYYAWHQSLIIPIVNKMYIILGIFINNNILDKTMKLLITTIIVILLSTIIDYIIRNTRLRFMLGINNQVYNNRVFSVR